ncbi:MAG: hypothetical protein U0P46_09525 [Holophagaceae bacterium]
MSNEELWISSFSGTDPGTKARGSSDLEALQKRADIRVLPLQRQASAMLEALPALGSVDYTTGNAGATCTRREQVRGILSTGEGTTLFGDAGSLRWLDQSWRHSVAVLSRGEDFTDTPPCLLLFGEGGDLAHQITLWDPATWEGFIDLVCRHRGCWTCLQHRAETPGAGPASECPAWMLKEAWCEAESERDLDLRLGRLGLGRVTALRAMEGLFTTPIEVRDLAALLTDLASSQVPVHLQVGNRHCTQVLESPLDAIRLDPQAWEIQMAQTTLRIHPDRIDSAWSVVQPLPGGERQRFECYDAAGGQVLSLSCPLAPCPLVEAGWQGVLGRFEARKLI